MTTLRSFLFLFILTVGISQVSAQSTFSNGDFEHGRSKWNLIEGARVIDTPSAERKIHGLRYLELSLHDKKPAKVQREFKIKRPFSKILIRMDVLLPNDTSFNPDQKPPIHAGIRHGSGVSAFLGHRYLQPGDLKLGEWTTIEKEIMWEDILDSFKKSRQEEAVFEIELMRGKGKIFVDNIEIRAE